MSKEEAWEELKVKLEGHLHAMMDAPYMGWTREFINGYELAIKRVKKDMEQLEAK